MKNKSSHGIIKCSCLVIIMVMATCCTRHDKNEKTEHSNINDESAGHDTQKQPGSNAVINKNTSITPSSSAELSVSEIERLKRIAPSDAEAANRLSVYYGFANNDTKQYFYYLRMAAKLGNTNDQTTLGMLLAEDTKTKAEGMRWLRKAADSGNSYAQYNLGDILIQNKETMNEGIKYIKLAADQGELYAQVEYGLMLIKSKKTKEEGMKYIQKAADDGDDYAKNVLQRISENKPLH